MFDKFEKSSVDAPEQSIENLTTLKVKGGNWRDEDVTKRPTDPQGLARSILHVLANKGAVNVNSVGNVALNITMKAYRIAKMEVASRTTETTLVIDQTEYKAVVNGKPAKGLCTRIFPIPRKDLV